MRTINIAQIGSAASAEKNFTVGFGGGGQPFLKLRNRIGADAFEAEGSAIGLAGGFGVEQLFAPGQHPLGSLQGGVIHHGEVLDQLLEVIAP